MQPAHAQLAEDVVPVEVAWFKLAGRRVASVGNAHRPAQTKAAFGKIQPVTYRAPHAVVGSPPDELGIHPALQNELFEQPAHVVVGESGANGRAQPETAPQTTGHVILAASFPDFEFARGPDATLARVQAQHDFAQGDQVVATTASGFNA